MVHKSALLHLLHRCIIVAFCLIITLTLLLSTMLFIKRQQATTENQSLHLSHLLIKQMAYSLAPLINNYDNNTSDNNKQILSSLELLVKNDWLLDASVYLINGQLIASVGETVPTRDRLHLDDATTANKKTDQLIQCIELQGRPIGFIRFTVDNSILRPSANTIEQLIHIIWGILILAVLTGFILAKTLQIHPSINLTSVPKQKQQSNEDISPLSTDRILNDMPDNDLSSDHYQNTLDIKDKQHGNSDIHS